MPGRRWRAARHDCAEHIGRACSHVRVSLTARRGRPEPDYRAAGAGCKRGVRNAVWPGDGRRATCLLLPRIHIGFRYGVWGLAYSLWAGPRLGQAAVVRRAAHESIRARFAKYPHPRCPRSRHRSPPTRHGRDGALGFFFSIGHGHYTQFLNFQECFPPDQGAPRRMDCCATETCHAVLLGHLPFAAGGGAVSGQPARLRARRAWRRQTAGWDALFFGGMQISYLPFLRRWPTYLYTDLTPSLKRELVPLVRPPTVLFLPPCKPSGNVWKGGRTTPAGAFLPCPNGPKAGVCRDYGVPERQGSRRAAGSQPAQRWPFVDRGGRTGPTPHFDGRWAVRI